jgi:hypothetical protein
MRETWPARELGGEVNLGKRGLGMWRSRPIIVQISSGVGRRFPDLYLITSPHVVLEAPDIALQRSFAGIR